ncbi:MAG: hypothetical protein K2W95_29445 [Candidatus Obscuribacterales bacterium]|nr:hypothetical protein [Candidatus Obscuribacterales bacterium]
MKYFLAILAASLLLTGCGPSEAQLEKQRAAETAAQQGTELDQKAAALDAVWAKASEAAKQNHKAASEHKVLKGNIDYVRKDLANGSIRTVESSLKTAHYWDLSYLERVARAEALHNVAETRLKKLEQPVKTANCARALYHLTQAREDLAAAVRYGYSVDLIELATQELEFVDKLFASTGDAKPVEHSTVALRDKLFQTGQKRANLKARPFAHLEAAENCVHTHREALGNDGWHQLLIEMTEDYLQRAKPVVTRSNLRETRATRIVECLEDILDVRAAIDQNCPGNTEAKNAIADAEVRLKNLTRSLITLSHNERVAYGPVLEAIKAAADAMTKNP